MTRRAARVSHDDLSRMVKAVRGQGLSIRRIEFDGVKLGIVINNGDSGDEPETALPAQPQAEPLLREPKL